MADGANNQAILQAIKSPQPWTGANCADFYFEVQLDLHARGLKKYIMAICPRECVLRYTLDEKGDGLMLHTFARLRGVEPGVAPNILVVKVAGASEASAALVSAVEHRFENERDRDAMQRFLPALVAACMASKAPGASISAAQQSYARELCGDYGGLQPPTPILQGVAQKKGKFTWSERFIVLQPGRLCVFRDYKTFASAHVPPLNVLSLSFIILTKVDQRVLNVQKADRGYQLQFANATERDRWMFAIDACGQEYREAKPLPPAPVAAAPVAAAASSSPSKVAVVATKPELMRVATSPVAAASAPVAVAASVPAAAVVAAEAPAPAAPAPVDDDAVPPPPSHPRTASIVGVDFAPPPPPPPEDSIAEEEEGGDEEDSKRASSVAHPRESLNAAAVGANASTLSVPAAAHGKQPQSRSASNSRADEQQPPARNRIQSANVGSTAPARDARTAAAADPSQRLPTVADDSVPAPPPPLADGDYEEEDESRSNSVAVRPNLPLSTRPSNASGSMSASAPSASSPAASSSLIRLNILLEVASGTAIPCLKLGFVDAPSTATLAAVRALIAEELDDMPTEYAFLLDDMPVGKRQEAKLSAQPMAPDIKIRATTVVAAPAPAAAAAAATSSPAAVEQACPTASSHPPLPTPPSAHPALPTPLGPAFVHPPLPTPPAAAAAAAAPTAAVTESSEVSASVESTAAPPVAAEPASARNSVSGAGAAAVSSAPVEAALSEPAVDDDEDEPPPPPAPEPEAETELSVAVAPAAVAPPVVNDDQPLPPPAPLAEPASPSSAAASSPSASSSAPAPDSAPRLTPQSSWNGEPTTFTFFLRSGDASAAAGADAGGEPCGLVELTTDPAQTSLATLRLQLLEELDDLPESFVFLQGAEVPISRKQEGKKFVAAVASTGGKVWIKVAKPAAATAPAAPAAVEAAPSPPLAPPIAPPCAPPLAPAFSPSAASSPKATSASSASSPKGAAKPASAVSGNDALLDAIRAGPKLRKANHASHPSSGGNGTLPKSPPANDLMASLGAALAGRRAAVGPTGGPAASSSGKFFAAPKSVAAAAPAKPAEDEAQDAARRQSVVWD